MTHNPRTVQRTIVDAVCWIEFCLNADNWHGAKTDLHAVTMIAHDWYMKKQITGAQYRQLREIADKWEALSYAAT